MIDFILDGESISLIQSEGFQLSRQSNYRDTSIQEMDDVLAKMQDGKHWKNAVEETFAESNPWLHSIITHPSRSKFLEEHPPTPDDLVLDIGAGWGQTALPLARTNRVCALEPTPERLGFIQAAAQQEKVEKNLYFLGADYLDVDFKTRFDLILSIGVLEWVGAFRNDSSAKETQRIFLAKIRRELNKSGRLVIGIENRLGLKYLRGCRDDHTGKVDISCYQQDLANKLFQEATGRELRCLTYSMSEYQNMLLAAGFSSIKFHAAFPDYKLPQVILPANGCNTVNNFFKSGQFIAEHDGCDGQEIPEQEKLKSLYLSLAEIGIAHYFAPSFFIECS